ncbi:NAD(P)/FAD-dependent oxidoreductase [Loktanella sp. S4079]|uniref:NAD(P)/FAD-dependent oxidoreductase n=1 Tax=Loktanella sp. S4079 TaxID=579483 RepID=UPI0005FA1519|nr:FAD-dependent oxidoreductase [Loktanella sp. S4079]KJZ20791.1 glycerol-3-phosphate dehydrogenase [Loktanella sp. S4079]
MIDFLIIGGGIAGASAAARLSDLGSVTVLEAEESLAYHASGRSAALFEQNYGRPSTVALNTASYAFHCDANVLSPRGIMLVGQAEEHDRFAADMAQMQIPPITLTEAFEKLPILDPAKITHAAFDDRAQDIDTDRLVQTFVRMAKANGAQILTRSPVTKINRTETGWNVLAGSDTFDARNIVNAAGGWVDHIAELAGISPIGFTPMRRSMARIPAPDGADVSRWPMVFGAGEAWYAKPDAGALIVSPADEDPVAPHDVYAEDLTLAEGLARFEDNVTMPVTRLISSWAGMRTFAPDRQLVIGRDPSEPSFIWCAGQGGYGMQSAPAASQLLGDLIGDRQPEIDSDIVGALSPARFR